jgi:hypothetical protein
MSVATAVGPSPPAAHAVDPAGVAAALRAFAAAATAVVAAGTDATAPEDGFPDPPPGEVTWVQISRGVAPLGTFLTNSKHEWSCH